MFQNIKVDIIYYKTATDFEMEFNLSGCCRMRLLTDKAPDRKILVNQLVRAVSRSRIIMIAGALFGETGVIETCAKAIGRPLIQIDNKKFGISEADNIEIIKDAIPLVSSDGIFGGCIIEQGPQTLILLSENKNIRKNIMQTLIHSYVKEVCASELTEKTTDAEIPVVNQSALEELPENETVEEIITDQDETSEEGIAFEEDLTNQLISDDDEEELPQVVAPIEEEYENTDDLVWEIPTAGRFKFKKKSVKYKEFDEDSEDYVTDDYSGTKQKRSLGINLPIILISILLLVVTIILCYSIFVVPSSQGVSTGEYLKETYNTLFG